MNWVPYAGFAIGMAIGLEFGFRWGQRYMFNKFARVVQMAADGFFKECKDDGKALERKEDEPHEEPKEPTTTAGA